MNKILVSTLIAAGVYLVTPPTMDVSVKFSIVQTTFIVALLTLYVRGIVCRVQGVGVTDYNIISSYADSGGWSNNFGIIKVIKVIFKTLRWTIKIALLVVLLPLKIMSFFLNDPYDPWNPHSPYY